MRDFVERRLLAFGMVVGSGLLLLMLVIARGVTNAVSREHFAETSVSLGTVEVVQTVLSLTVVAAISAVTYKLLPDRDVPWKSAWTGAALTSVLFNAGILFLGAYVGWITRTQSFGPAGAFVFLLVWLYYSAQAFMLGAELSRAHARQRE
jgi:membrane protein